MGKFAKLYEVENEQVLVKLATNAEGHPSVHFITEVEGIEIIVGPSFGPKDESKPYSEDEAWSVAEAYFDNVDEERALAARAGIVKMLQEQVPAKAQEG